MRMVSTVCVLTSKKMEIPFLWATVDSTVLFLLKTDGSSKARMISKLVSKEKDSNFVEKKN